MTFSHYNVISLTNFTLYFVFLLFITGTEASTVGITYRANDNIIPPDRVASLIRSMKLTSVRLPEPEPALIRAFTDYKISMLIYVPNSLVPSFADNRSNVQAWLNSYIVPFYPQANIKMISVGTDIPLNSSGKSYVLLSAIRNLHQALGDIGISNISVSTTFSFLSIMVTPFPPSSAEFLEPLNVQIIKPLLQFISETNSSFLCNIYPYNVILLNSEIPIGFSLFEKDPLSYRNDAITNVLYTNLFDMMVDAVITAMKVSGYENISLIVTETGWPSSDNVSEASEIYAERYLDQLLCHLNIGGTPLRKEGVAEAYIFELLDDNTKSQTVSQWGILYANATHKYNYVFVSGPKMTDVASITTLIVLLAIGYVGWGIVFLIVKLRRRSSENQRNPPENPPMQILQICRANPMVSG